MSENIKQVLEFLESSVDSNGTMTRYISVEPDDRDLEFNYPHAPNIQPNSVRITYQELIEALKLLIAAKRPGLFTHSAWIGDSTGSAWLDSAPEIRGHRGNMLIVDDLEANPKQSLRDFVNNMKAQPPVVESAPGIGMSDSALGATQPEARLARYDKFMAKAREIVTQKNHDYAGGKVDVDPNANFVEIARLLEGAPITPYTVAMIYQLKHVFSLLTYAKTGRQESGEALIGRHQDVSNYSFILNELVKLHEACFAHYSVPAAGSDEKLAA